MENKTFSNNRKVDKTLCFSVKIHEKQQLIAISSYIKIFNTTVVQLLTDLELCLFFMGLALIILVLSKKNSCIKGKNSFMMLISPDLILIVKGHSEYLEYTKFFL